MWVQFCSHTRGQNKLLGWGKYVASKCGKQCWWMSEAFNIKLFTSTFMCFKRKKFWNKVECQHSEKRSQTHKRLLLILIEWNGTKRAHFRGSPLFQARYNLKAEKTTIHSTYLVSVRCGRLAEGKGHETDSNDGSTSSHGQSVSCPFPSASLTHLTDTR